MRNNKITALCLLLALVVLGGCTVPVVPVESTEPSRESVPSVTEWTEPEGYAVRTPVGMLSYPGEWADLVKVRSDGETLTFLAVLEEREQPLFDLWFSQTDGTGAVGMVPGEEGNYYVGFRVHDFEPDPTWDREQADTVYAMQEALNVLLAQLPLVAVEEMPETDLVIETAYGGLHYPSRWADYLKVEQPDETHVEFYAALPDRDPELLFTVVFGAADAAVMISDETGVGFEFREPEFDGSWTQAEIDTVLGMQEDINYLLDALTQE